MKAAILHEPGKAPVYEETSAPVPQNGEQLLMLVKAASVKNIDKLRAGGTHYASYKQLPVIVGIDAVGVLEDGTRVYAQGLTGMIAEAALIAKGRYTVLPEELDFIIAAALPNAVLGAAMAMLSRGKMQAGQTVLINGATGVTGRLAVQIAKHYGAARIIVTGRNSDALGKLKTLGADETISLKQDDAAIVAQLKASYQPTPPDLVIDYLWGQPISLILQSLAGGGVNVFTQPVKVVTVGDMAGATIPVASGLLRSSAIELLGSGLGSLSQADIAEFGGKILPEMFRLAAAGTLELDTVTEPLENIEAAWTRGVEPGKRLVITMG